MILPDVNVAVLDWVCPKNVPSKDSEKRSPMCLKDGLKFFKLIEPIE